MLDFLKGISLKAAQSPVTENAAKGMAVGGGSLSISSVLSFDVIMGIVGATIAFISLVVSIYFGRLRAKEEVLRRLEMKRANDLKELELTQKIQSKENN